MILNTARFSAHSKGDDTREAAEVEHLRATRDPLKVSAARLPLDKLTAIHEEVNAEVQRAFQVALTDPTPSLEVRP